MTVSLSGERVTLRSMSIADLPLLIRWGSDAEFRQYQWGQGPGRFEETAARSWIEVMSRPGESACWVIEHESRGVGFANYRNSRPKARSAEIGIGIGEPALWGRHLGREALGLLVRHLEDDLGLRRVSLHVIATNDRAVWAYKACGFEVEGIERGADGEIVGTTRYAHIDPANRTLEIGWTFYGKGARRTAVNTEAKLLLLGHAFDALTANRVWLQTDRRNERSQQAMARLGATKDAELRDERILADGALRTSVIYAITRPDWDEVRARLRAFLGRPGEMLS